MSALRGPAQVVAIGNAFELVHQQSVDYGCLSELDRIDERHFGQKTTFWSTRYGFPAVVVCTSRPSAEILDAVFGSRLRPRFLEPARASSSICNDLLADARARRALLSCLDPARAVYLAPYVHTTQVERVADFLTNAGYYLVDFLPQASLVRKLCDKLEAERTVFNPVSLLRAHRPLAITAESDDQLADVFLRFVDRGTHRVVVKSASAVGGAGVFFVDPADAARVSPLDLLLGLGQNAVTRSGRYLVEEHVPWDASPTVDLDVRSSDRIDVVGVALQRLFDGRYYTGFHASPLLMAHWWYAGVNDLARRVGARLAELGYRGPANVDFVVSSASRRITLIEVNPRRSALIDGFSLRKLIPNMTPTSSISVTDYVNIAGCLPSLDAIFRACTSRVGESSIVCPVADGGFSSSFRWVGVWATTNGRTDSEEVLQEAILRLQDPAREEVGSIQRDTRGFTRVFHDAA